MRTFVFRMFCVAGAFSVYLAALWLFLGLHGAWG